MASELVLDSSAIVAILLEEPGFERLVRLIDSCERVWVGAPTLTETFIVLSMRLQRDVRGLLSEFLAEARAEVIPFDSRYYRLSAEAFWRFGKGRHPAGLNYGDCQSYAVAQSKQCPLLFVGNDFTKTDVIRVS